MSDRDVAERQPAEKSRLSPAKQLRIIMAARKLFFARGFGATSMEAVAREAAVGKATLYENFPNKVELLRAVIGSELGVRADTLTLDHNAAAPLRGVLTTFAYALFDLLLSPSNVALYRIISAEVPRYPELGAVFYENGPSQVIGELADFFAGLMEQGRLLPGNPRLVAAQFIGLIRADLQTRSMLGIDEDVRDTERAITVENGIDVFLRAYARLPA